jgi:hypothetical protein
MAVVRQALGDAAAAALAAALMQANETDQAAEIQRDPGEKLRKTTMRFSA